MTSVDEGTSAVLELSLFDRDGQLQAPVSARFRIDDQASGAAVQAWQSLSAASEQDVPLTVANNAILNSQGKNEVRVVTVEATYADGKLTGQFGYRVTALPFYG